MCRVFDNGWEATGDLDGEEPPPWFDDSMFEAGFEPYSPSFVSGAERIGDVVGIANIDTESERYPWMFRTFLRIVAEELQAARAAPARIIPFFTPEWIEWMREHGVIYPSHDQLA
jgi:hypothetical protein